MQHKYFGRTDERVGPAGDAGIAALVQGALRPLAVSVGLDEAALAKAVERDLSRRVAKVAFDSFEAEGIRLSGAHVLDLGAGLGQASVEAVLRGCELMAVEPGIEWCGIVRRRLEEVGRGEAIVADGEKLPFSDDLFDLVVSIGVLEHVRHPEAFLGEAYRVLKPGGCMFLSCENYLSFREPHYQLAWLPLFPKRLASIYLRLRGRSDEFLMTSIYYTTRRGVIGRLRSLGFRFKRQLELHDKVRRRLRPGGGSGSKLAQGLGDAAASAIARVLFEVESLRAMFTPYVAMVVQKPAARDAAASTVTL